LIPFWWLQCPRLPWFLAGAAWLIPALALAAETPNLDTWKLEVLHRKGGKAFKGLVVEETPRVIKFWEVKRPVGLRTVRIYHTFNRREVERIDRLDARERELLAGRIHALDPEGKAEKLLMENLNLERVPWGKDKKGEAWSYTSVQFVLLSDAREDVVRRAAVRLEQIYAAYSRFLPPRRPLTRPTTICLVHSVAEYEDLAKSQGHKIFNPAFYNLLRNEIVCGSEFQRLGEDLEKVRKQQQDLEKRVADLNKRYKGKIPALIKNQIFRDRKELARVHKKNDEVFNKASESLFRTLYHEAFHAYLANFVYPPKEASVPYWLNEGLAQIFETALVEANELRVGHVDKERLVKVKALAQGGDLVPLEDLLKAGAKQFHVTHASNQQLADRYYLTSWALAFYLLVDRKVLIDPKKLNQYASALKRGNKPAQVFRDLVGKPLPQFQKDFREYLLRLKPDGSLAREPKK
jgi:hypothetical protein